MQQNTIQPTLPTMMGTPSALPVTTHSAAPQLSSYSLLPSLTSSIQLSNAGLLMDLPSPFSPAKFRPSSPIPPLVPSSARPLALQHFPSPQLNFHNRNHQKMASWKISLQSYGAPPLTTKKSVDALPLSLSSTPLNHHTTFPAALTIDSPSEDGEDDNDDDDENELDLLEEDSIDFDRVRSYSIHSNYTPRSRSPMSPVSPSPLETQFSSPEDISEHSHMRQINQFSLHDPRQTSMSSSAADKFRRVSSFNGVFGSPRRAHSPLHAFQADRRSSSAVSLASLASNLSPSPSSAMLSALYNLSSQNLSYLDSFSWEKLPLDMLYSIFLFLDVSSMLKAGAVNRIWHEASIIKDAWSGKTLILSVRLNDSFLAQIYRSILNLQSLELKFTQNITESGWYGLKNLRHLSALTIFGGARNSSARHLKDMTQLKSLMFAHCSVSDVAFQSLACMDQLKHLAISSCEYLTDKALQSISNLHALESLQLSHLQITDDGIGHLHFLADLQTLSVDTCHLLTDITLHHVAQFPALKQIEFQHIKTFTDLGMQQLVSNPSFNQRCVAADFEGCTSISEEGFAFLAAFEQLSSLNISLCRVNDGTLHALRSLKLLKTLRLNGVQCSDKGIQLVISACPLLENLQLRLCSLITDLLLKSFVETLPSKPFRRYRGLQLVDVSYCMNVHKKTALDIMATKYTPEFHLIAEGLQP